MIKTDMRKETIFKVTFSNGADIMISAQDEAHALRIVETNHTLVRHSLSTPQFTRAVQSITKAN